VAYTEQSAVGESDRKGSEAVNSANECVLRLSALETKISQIRFDLDRVDVGLAVLSAKRVSSGNPAR
jgi:hypothetical protein